MVKRILNLKIIFEIGYCVLISTFVVRLANYAVVACYNSTEKLNEQNQIANFMLFKWKIVFVLFQWFKKYQETGGVDKTTKMWK